MTNNVFPELKIGDLVCPTPIIQGGMGVGISLSGLASAVANQGGIGVIATPGIGMLEPDYKTDFLAANERGLRKEIRKARELTKGVIGVNIMMALSNFADLARVAIEEGIDIIFSGAGLPVNLPQYLTPGSKTKLVPIVSSAKAARIICKRWFDRYQYLPDAVVVEGPMAGGHLGFSYENIDNPEYALDKLIPEVVSVVNDFAKEHNKTIPVIAAGGIFTGADIRRFLGLGASGVQMATRFVTTHECDASMNFKQLYLSCKKEDIVIIKSPVGMPGRVIQNQFVEDIKAGQKKPFKCPYHCIVTCDVVNSPYCIGLVLENSKKGDLDNSFAFAGANAYRTTELLSVKQLIDTLAEEYKQAS